MAGISLLSYFKWLWVYIILSIYNAKGVIFLTQTKCLCLHLLLSFGAVIKRIPGDGEHLALCHAAHQTGLKTGR